MVSNCNVGATTYTVCWVGTIKWCLNEKVELLCKLAMPCLSSGVCLQAGHASPVKWCLNEKVELLCKAGHALPVKWCLKAKVLLGKWSAIAMLELQRIWFAGWALTEGAAGHASPVKWCLNEKVELLCKLAMPRLSSGV